MPNAKPEFLAPYLRLSKSVLFLGETFCALQNNLGRLLQVFLIKGLGPTKDGVTLSEVRVKDSIGKTPHANPDTLQHTIASKLVHDERGFNFKRLLVSVWYNASDEMWLSCMKGCHQSAQVGQENT